MKSAMYLKDKNCDDKCIRPAGKRLALLGARDELECYAESYVKCFWGLCDHHKSIEGFAKDTPCDVITHQPTRQDMPVRPSGVIQNMLMLN